MTTQDEQKAPTKRDQFREKITSLRRQAGRQQQELARSLGLAPHVLSRKLHGLDQAHLTHDEVKLIILTLASWHAIATQDEAIELLALMNLKRESFAPEEWRAVPLNHLTPSNHRLAPALSQGSSGRPVSAGRSGIPTPLTSFIGRDWALKALRQLLQQENVRLVTLLGTGGVGKTRLALALASLMSGDFTDGVSFVSLAAIHEPSLVPTAIAQALALLSTAPAMPPLDTEQLLKVALTDKDMLLVLDNFEQVLPAASVLAALLQASPRLKALVTSRAVLHIYGEHLFGVSPLEIPDPHSLPELPALEEFPAIRLFVERARAVRPGFTLTTQNAPAITQLCIRLDGLPLAIELAAARTRFLSPNQVLERLEGRRDEGQHSTATDTGLALLRHESRDVPERQRTLLKTLDWSYQLLDPATQRLLAWLSVFEGDWTLETALAVCQQEGEADETLFNRLEMLINSSLVVSTHATFSAVEEDSARRFWLLETIREYAQGRLQESGELERVRRRHAHYYLSLVEQIEPYLVGPQRLLSIQRLAHEQENLRAALRWSMQQEEASLVQRLCGALGLFWEAHSQFKEAHQWIDAAIARGRNTPEQVRAKLFLAASRLALWEMTNEQARTQAQQALTLYKSCGDAAGRAAATFQVGDAWHMQGDYARASGYFEESLNLQRELGDRRAYAFTLSRLGAIAMLQGDFSLAQSRLTEAVTLFRVYGEPWGLSVMLNFLGVLSLLQRNLLLALAYLQEGLLLAQETGNQFNIAMNLIASGCTLGVVGGPVYAAQICSAGEVLFERLGTTLPVAYDPLYRTYLQSARSQVDEATWHTWWLQGKTFSQEQAIKLTIEMCRRYLAENTTQ
jgi:predicted ATPase